MLIDQSRDEPNTEKTQIPAVTAAEDRVYDEAIHCLVCKGAYLDEQDNSGWTPLFYAVNSNNMMPLLQLIKEEADVNVRTFLKFQLIL